MLGERGDGGGRVQDPHSSTWPLAWGAGAGGEQELRAPSQIRPGFGALGGRAAPHAGFSSWARSGRCRRSSSAPEHPTGSSQRGTGGASRALSIPQQHPRALWASFGVFSALFLSKRACPALQLSHTWHLKVCTVTVSQEGIISIPGHPHASGSALGTALQGGQGMLQQGLRWGRWCCSCSSSSARISEHLPHADELNPHKPPGKQVKVVIFILQRQNPQ